MILYFSATGNTLYIAKNLAYLNHDEVINLTEYLKENKKLVLNSNLPYIILSPIYLSTIPSVLYKLLMESKLGGNQNIYFIFTCAGSGSSAASLRALKIAKKNHMNYRGCYHLSMPQDYLMFFKVLSKEENDLKMDMALKNIDYLSKTIMNNSNLNMDKVSIFHRMSIKPVEFLFNHFFIHPKKFYAKESCIGCGQCVKLCPLNNITLKNKRPVWKDKCIHCTACINHCPKMAIEYGKKTIGKNRYVARKFNR